MAIPVYLWLKDDGGADIKGSVDVQDREGSIEVVAQEHNLYIPTDNNTGKLTGTRIHTPFLFTKEIDSSSPYLYKAVTTGQTLKSAEFKWYRINDAGQEVEYFNTKLENVKVVKVNPLMHDIKTPPTRSTTIWNRLSCATRRSPGPIKTATSFTPIAGTNAPPRNCPSYFAPLARRRRSLIPAASLSLRPGIIAGDRLMRAAFLCPPFFAERLRYGFSAKKNTICLPDLVRLGFLFGNSDGR
ncbi:type VI secretion system effector [Klebsiella pneumoniae]|nr:type VI secretion system effector [Klebsiella pneumoniae]